MLRVLLYFILKIIQIDHMRIGKILSLYLLFKHQMILLKETKKLENLNGLHLIKFHQKKKWHLIMATTLYFIRNIFPQNSPYPLSEKILHNSFRILINPKYLFSFQSARGSLHNSFVEFFCPY